jgi:hypothetical protein
MTYDNLPWQLPHRSGSSGSCVEVAITDDAVYVRDSKDRTLPPHKFTRHEWEVFTGSVHDGQYEL